jgi:hypothetical protein
MLESLSLASQGVLLLLGCAFSKYLWEVNADIASVVLGVTSFGALFSLFIIATGTIFNSRPYQTPVTDAIRQVPKFFRSFIPIFSVSLVRPSIMCRISLA